MPKYVLINGVSFDGRCMMAKDIVCRILLTGGAVKNLFPGKESFDF